MQRRRPASGNSPAALIASSSRGETRRCVAGAMAPRLTRKEIKKDPKKKKTLHSFLWPAYFTLVRFNSFATFFFFFLFFGILTRRRQTAIAVCPWPSPRATLLACHRSLSLPGVNPCAGWPRLALRLPFLLPPLSATASPQVASIPFTATSPCRCILPRLLRTRLALRLTLQTFLGRDYKMDATSAPKQMLLYFLFFIFFQVLRKCLSLGFPNGPPCQT